MPSTRRRKAAKSVLPHFTGRNVIAITMQEKPFGNIPRTGFGLTEPVVKSTRDEMIMDSAAQPGCFILTAIKLVII